MAVPIYRRMVAGVIPSALVVIPSAKMDLHLGFLRHDMVGVIRRHFTSKQVRGRRTPLVGRRIPLVGRRAPLVGRRAPLVGRSTPTTVLVATPRW